MRMTMFFVNGSAATRANRRLLFIRAYHEFKHCGCVECLPDARARRGARLPRTQ